MGSFPAFAKGGPTGFSSFFSIAYSDFVETQADKLIRHDASRDMVAVLNLLDPWFVECMEVQTVVNYGNAYN